MTVDRQLIVRALCLFFSSSLPLSFLFLLGWLGSTSKGGGSSSHVASDFNVNSFHHSSKLTRSYFLFLLIYSLRLPFSCILAAFAFSSLISIFLIPNFFFFVVVCGY